MTSCILRVSGSTTKVRKFLSASSIEPLHIYWKGDPRFPKSRGPLSVSGFNIQLSSGEGLQAQAQGAVRYIRRHEADMRLIKSLGFANRTLDFGLHDLATEDRPWPCYYLPASLVQMAGELGWRIGLSFYGPPDTA